MKSRPAIEGNRQHNDNLNSRVNKSRDTKKETFKIGFSYRLVSAIGNGNVVEWAIIQVHKLDGIFMYEFEIAEVSVCFFRIVA